jgi:hypothetical protein
VRTWLSNKKKVHGIHVLGMSQRLMWFIVAELCMADEDSDDVCREVGARPSRCGQLWRAANLFVSACVAAFNLHVHEQVLGAWLAEETMRFVTLAAFNLIKRRRSGAANFPPRQRVDDFRDPVFFRVLFRFDKADFHRILMNLGWLLADGSPMMIRFGRDGRMYSASADWVFMCLCRRLAKPCTIEDVCLVCGGGRTAVDDAIIFAMNFVYERYKSRLCDLRRFAPLFPAMAKHLQEAGCPFDHCVGFLDGNNQFTARTGGAGNVHECVDHLSALTLRFLMRSRALDWLSASPPAERLASISSAWR